MNCSGVADAEHIGKYVNRLSKDIRYTMNNLISEKGYPLTAEQSRVLGFIQCSTENGSCVHQKDIEKHFGIKRSSVASILSNMEKGGYIFREVDKRDARIKRVILTEKGRELQKEIRLTVDMIEEILSRNMSAEEKSEFIRLTQLALENLKSADISSHKGDTDGKEFSEKC
ncbi:MAG: MarR family transcriptional regulator [Oscillospiraceae bacterium]|nr:MarR family transcriptional regulator [Oscillospiraceae bacterium]